MYVTAVTEPAEIVNDGDELRVLHSGFRFIEGPSWHPDGYLIFTDIPASVMYRLGQGNALSVERTPSNKANGTTWDREGRLIVCEHELSRVVRLEHDGTETVVADSFEGRELNSPNDVIVASDGTIFFTDPDFGRSLDDMGVVREVPQEFHGVYRVDPNGTLSRIVDDFVQPNGLCLSPDERHLFVNDTARGDIRRFALDGQRVTGGEVWAHPEGEGPGSVDGMKIDSAGNLYCTGPGGVFVYGEDATLLGVIPVPEAVGNFTWGDEGLNTMYFCASTTLFARHVRVPGSRVF